MTPCSCQDVTTLHDTALDNDGGTRDVRYADDNDERCDGANMTGDGTMNEPKTSCKPHVNITRTTRTNTGCLATTLLYAHVKQIVMLPTATRR